MRFRSTACVLGGILLAGHRAGLADSQSANLSIQVVVTRSCAISTPAAGGLSVTCSRGPTPAIQSTTPQPRPALTAPAPAAAVSPMTSYALASTTASATASTTGATAPSTAASAGEAAAQGTADASPLAPSADDYLAEAPRQEILTINF